MPDTTPRPDAHSMHFGPAVGSAMAAIGCKQAGPRTSFWCHCSMNLHSMPCKHTRCRDVNAKLGTAAQRRLAPGTQLVSYERSHL